ncbi:MAG: hypothetical protein WDN45_12335 [Caulobacteraceae bacterium]
MPFAINESTRFISPTKTPEYLAGGRPVVSTAITDVIRHYGELDGVLVAHSYDRFVADCDLALALAADPKGPLAGTGGRRPGRSVLEPDLRPHVGPDRPGCPGQTRTRPKSAPICCRSPAAPGPSPRPTTI